MLLTVLLCTLGYHQLVISQNYRLMEEKQAQRRILTPGSRGDVFDREGRLMIGNRPRFAAVVYQDDLRQEFRSTYLSMVRRARKVKAAIDPNSSLMGTLRGIAPGGIHRKDVLKIKGQGKPRTNHVVIWQNQRSLARSDSKGRWETSFDKFYPDREAKIETGSKATRLKMSLAGLCEIKIFRDTQGTWRLEPKEIPRIDGEDLRWESRLAVIRKYLREINRITGRREEIGMLAFKRHFNQRLLLPLRLADDLSPKEYARLVENLPVDSPVQVLTEAARHYPFGPAAAHVLGYVSGARNIDPEAIPGSDLSTVSFKGKTGKAGIEKFFNDHLSGKDGGEIWHVDPIGYQYERVLHKAPRKGKSLQLSLDVDLQIAAEESLAKEITSITSRRTAKDEDWLAVVTKRVRQKLLKSTSLEPAKVDSVTEVMKRATRPLETQEITKALDLQISPEELQDLFASLTANGTLTEQWISDSSRRFGLSSPPPPPGAIVLIKIKTGEILAIASKPDYDLNDLSPRISSSTFRDIQGRGAWLPRTIHPGYPPASTYKLMTAVTALRAGKWAPDHNRTCDGIYKGMECHVFPGRHGEMNMMSAIAQSCNVYFFQMGEQAGYNTLIAESKRFGMNERPPIQLPGVPDKPLVPDPAWKKKKIGIEWTLEDTFNMSIGQGGFKLSPLQVACLTASFARGETRTIPTLLKLPEGSSITDHGGEPIGLLPQQYQDIVRGMNLAAEQGTARRCKVPGIRLAGKTGTGQWRSNNMELNLAWFIAFAPLDDPEVAIAVLVEGTVPQDNVQGGLNAATVAGKVLRKYFEKKKQAVDKKVVVSP